MWRKILAEIKFACGSPYPNFLFIPELSQIIFRMINQNSTFWLERNFFSTYPYPIFPLRHLFLIVLNIGYLYLQKNMAETS